MTTRGLKGRLAWEPPNSADEKEVDYRILEDYHLFEPNFIWWNKYVDMYKGNGVQVKIQMRQRAKITWEQNKYDKNRCSIL